METDNSKQENEKVISIDNIDPTTKLTASKPFIPWQP